MSSEVLRLVWNIDEKHLNSTETSVLCRLAFFGNNTGDKIYPSYETLAQDTKFTKRTIINTINNLEGKGFIEKTIKPGDQRRHFKINVILLKKSQRLKNHKGVNDVHRGGESPSPVGVNLIHQGVNDVHRGGESPSLKSVSSPPSNSYRMRHTGRAKFSKYTTKTLERHYKHTQRESVCEKDFFQQDKNFQMLGELWIKKEGLSLAKKRYNDIVPESISAEKLLSVARKKMDSLISIYAKEGDRIRYCPRLDTWLEQEGYLDEPHVMEKVLSKQDAFQEEIRRSAAKQRAIPLAEYLRRREARR